MIPPGKKKSEKLFMMFVRFSEFRGIYFYQDNQVAENEGTENKAHKTKQAQTYDDTENGDQRVDVPQPFIE